MSSENKQITPAPVPDAEPITARLAQPVQPTDDIGSRDEQNLGANNFVAACIAAQQSFAPYLTDSDTDTENASLPPTRRWVWYCKRRGCPGYYAAWACKSNFLLHLYETPIHREDSATTTKAGRRQLTRAWREETAFDLMEAKKRPPKEQEKGSGKDRDT